MTEAFTSHGSHTPSKQFRGPEDDLSIEAAHSEPLFPTLHGLSLCSSIICIFSSIFWIIKSKSQLRTEKLHEKNRRLDCTASRADIPLHTIIYTQKLSCYDNHWTLGRHTSKQQKHPSISLRRVGRCTKSAFSREYLYTHIVSLNQHLNNSKAVYHLT